MADCYQTAIIPMKRLTRTRLTWRDLVNLPNVSNISSMLTNLYNIPFKYYLIKIRIKDTIVMDVEKQVVMMQPMNQHSPHLQGG